METFFIPGAERSPSTITVDGEEGKHMTQVLRMRPGERCRIVDGRGNAFEVTVSDVGKGTALCQVDRHVERWNETATPVILAAGLLKNPSRFDFLVEKAVELGAGKIIPVITERTIARADKKARWEKIAIAAMKQCGRSVLPEISEPLPFASFLSLSWPGHLLLIPHEKSPHAFPSAHDAAGIVLAIGPEGGFTDDEVSAAEGRGYHTVSLGPRRLRAETAAAAALVLSAADRQH
jgi:16S rRNA (uracil1498-N3)-methyltransferase